jgi:hypothetical protein
MAHSVHHSFSEGVTAQRFNDTTVEKFGGAKLEKGN